MKRIVLLLVAILLTLTSYSQDMKAFISHKAYCTGTMQPYIEFTFVVGGNTVTYAKVGNNKYQADVEVRVDVTKGDTIVKTLHYVLASDLFNDSARAGKPDIADIQNLQVPNGDYFLKFYLEDKNADSSKLTYIDRAVLNFPEDRVSSSRISLYQDMTAADNSSFFVKYGFNLPPLFYNFVPETQYVLPFAMEIYNTKKTVGEGKSIEAKCYIEYAENKIIVNPNDIITKNLKADDVVLLIDQFNVFKLPSGNYFLIVELYDQDSLLLKSRVFFQKSNPSVNLDMAVYNDIVVDESFVASMTDRAVLEENVWSLYPISTVLEKNFYEKNLKKVPTDQLQRFFYAFWVSRSPKNPESAWLAYSEKIAYVQKRFGSLQVKGYRTDRGRVYLQYGEPNDILEIPSEPLTFPYEIWHYYYLDEQTNVKFVFYDPALVGNDYVLLHSNKYGELQNPNWKMQLVKGLQIQRDIYESDPEDYYGGDINNNWKYH